MFYYGIFILRRIFIVISMEFEEFPQMILPLVISLVVIFIQNLFYIIAISCFDSKFLNIYYFLMEMLVAIYYSLIFYSSFNGKQMPKSLAYACIYCIAIAWILFMIFNLASTIKILRDKIKSIIKTKKVTPAINIKTTIHEGFQKVSEKNRIV